MLERSHRVLREAGVKDEHGVTTEDGQQLIEIEGVDRVDRPLDGDEQRGFLRELARLEKPGADWDSRLRVKDNFLEVRVPGSPPALVPADPRLEWDLVAREPAEHFLLQVLHEFLPAPVPVL